LLVVIGILAVLLAILLPSLNLMREEAHRTQCAHNLSQIQLSLLSYSLDHNGLVPPICFTPPAGAGQLPDQRPHVPFAWSNPVLVSPLIPYGLDIKRITCPSTDLFSPPTLSTDPTDVGYNQYETDYCYLPGLYDPTINILLTEGSMIFDTNNSVPGLRPFANRTDWILLTDLNMYWDANGAGSDYYWSNHGGGQRWVSAANVVSYLQGSNRCYVDGHVEWTSPARMGKNNTKPTADGTTSHYSHSSSLRPYYW
jgi:prepilin-type processing-associated H-X9-DG protein